MRLRIEEELRHEAEPRRRGRRGGERHDHRDRAGVLDREGKLAHSLAVSGPGVSDQRIAGTIPPGASKALTVTLSQGTYEVYCPVPGHKQQGMVAHVTVGMAGPSGGSSGGMTTHSSNGY